jgi:NAD(P) transhydrogenase subunit alpha
LIVAVPKEIEAGERRVALVPESVRALVSEGLEIAIQSGAGEGAGFSDYDFADAGASMEPDAAALLSRAELVVKVQPPSDGEVDALSSGTALIGFLKPLDRPDLAQRLAGRGITAFAMELMPRITRAQSMDALSAMSTIAGYRAVLLAAAALPKIFPMLVTAAGTISPARVLVIGAGVAGLQAIATARRLGAVVESYDTRPAVKEQVESIGARFVELDLDTGDAEDAGGYARAQDEAFYVRQRELLGKHVAKADVVITTALVPGQRAPLLIDQAAVNAMRPGSVIVDLAAEQGGNTAGCEPDRTVENDGVSIIGASNLARDIPANASQMYAKNVTTFLKHLTQEGALVVDLDDEITRGSLLTCDGKITNERVLATVEGRGGAKV